MPRGEILVVNLPRKGATGPSSSATPATVSPGTSSRTPAGRGSPRPDGGEWDREDSLAMYLSDLRGLSDRTQAVAHWYDRALSPTERDEKRGELNRIYRIVAAGGTVSPARGT